MAYEQLWNAGVELAYLHNDLWDVQVDSPEAKQKIYDIAEALDKAGGQHLRKMASRSHGRGNRTMSMPWLELAIQADDLFFSLEFNYGDVQERLENLDTTFLNGVGYLIGREVNLDFTEVQAA
jgi:hypothetical protein